MTYALSSWIRVSNNVLQLYIFVIYELTLSMFKAWLCLKPCNVNIAWFR